MNENHDGIDFYIDKAITMIEGKNILIFGFTIYEYCDYLCESVVYSNSSDWHKTEQQAREAAIEYITSKM